MALEKLPEVAVLIYLQGLGLGTQGQAGRG